MAGKYSKKKNNSGLVWLACVLLIVIVILSIVLFIKLSNNALPETLTSNADSSRQETNEDIPGMAEMDNSATQDLFEETTLPDDRLPYNIANDLLVIESLFQYSGLNPDSGWVDGTDTAAVVLKNVSENYLEKLEMKIYLENGTVLEFIITDIPAGETVWAFDRNNTPLSEVFVVSDVKYNEVFFEGENLIPDQILLTVDGLQVQLKNTTDRDMANLNVYCRNIMEGVYFGGQSYAYTVDALPSGADITITAIDCFLGKAEVTLVK